MKKFLISILVLTIWTASLLAQITREQADAIVLNHVQSEVTQPYCLYGSIHTPNEEGIVLTTYREETFKAKYACWIYFLDENPNVNGPAQRRYLFVKEDTGNLLEVITSNDFCPDLDLWTVVSAFTGLGDWKENNSKLLYPNPVDDWLTIPCTSSRVEIYDLKGTRLFSGWLSEKDTCRLDVSFLSAGVYLVSVSGETYKIVKN